MKKYLVIGNGNAVKYKDIFPLIKDGEMRLGATMKNGSLYFEIPDKYTGPQVKVVDGKRLLRMSGARWFTNMKHGCYKKLVLTKKYDPEKYSKYDNYDVIDCKTNDIPIDYQGVIGVPITFLDKWDDDGEFEIVGMANGGSGGLDRFRPIINGELQYPRILIKRKLS